MATPFPFSSGQTLTAAQLNAITTLPTTTKTASHTLVIADQGTRVIMNSASATTITVNTSIFGAQDVVEIQNIGAGVCTVTAGSCTVSSAGPLAIPQHGGGQLVFSSASVATFFPTAVTASASGLVCVKAETALSGGSSTADSVFTSTYTNYRIIIRYQVSAAVELAMQFGVAGSYTATGYNFQRLNVNGSAVPDGVRSSSQTSAFIGQDAGAFTSLITLEISGPQLAEPTLYQAVNSRSASAYTTPTIVQYFGNQSASTQFDGIKFLVSSGTMSGSFTIYGYSKTV